MAINITDPDALEKLAEIEGEDWRSGQENLDGFSFGSFRRRYEELLAADEISKIPSRGVIKVDGNAAIYGFGGFNRYFVRPNGEIIFSRSHARDEDHIDAAKKLGITID